MLLSILLFFNFLVGETYYVIQLKGKIINVETNVALKAGDKLTPDTKLKFTTVDSKAILISSARGRFIISPVAASKGKESEITEFVKNVLLSHDKDDYRFMSTRGTAEEVDKTDLEGYFGVGKFFVFGDSIKVNIDVNKYKITPQKYVSLTYKYNGKEISKNFNFAGDQLIISKTVLFKVDGRPVSEQAVKKVDIYIYDESTKNSDYITSFIPVFVPFSQISDEMKIQLDIFKSMSLSKDEVRIELKNHVDYAYGNTDVQVIESLIDQLIANY